MKFGVEVDRRLFIASLGGAAAVAAMDHEARAEALEDYMAQQLEQPQGGQGVQPQGGQGPVAAAEKFPTVAELEAQNLNRSTRRGVGDVFVGRAGKVSKLEPMPARPTLQDFFKLRFSTVNHVLQSANRAMKTGMTEEIILACLLHDVSQSLIKVDHGWWGAQLFEPYVSEKVPSRFAITRRCDSTRTTRPATNIRTSTDACSASITSRSRTSRPRISLREPQVVHGASPGDSERSICVRSQGGGDPRAVPRHHRAAFQAA